MSRTTVTAFDSQTKQNVTLEIPAINLASDYSILERDVTSGSTVLSNITADPSLQEFISYKYGNINKVSVHPKLKAVYEPSTKDGYQIVAKDEWINRTTETDGTIHDDPEAIYVVYKTTRGANIVDGEDVLGRLIRLVGVAAKVKAASNAKANDTTYELDPDMLDRLIHGVTKPADAN